MKVYPWQLFWAGKWSKYLKFTSYWLKLDRYDACSKKAILNKLATEEFHQME